MPLETEPAAAAEMEIVPIEVAVQRLVVSDASNTTKIMQFEKQIDDLLRQITEFQTLSDRIESIQVHNKTSFDDMTNKLDDNKQQWNQMMHKLDLIGKSVTTSSNEHQNKTVGREEIEGKKPWTSTAEDISRYTFSTAPDTTPSHWGRPFETFPFRMEPETQQTTAMPSVFPLNGVKHSIIVPPSSAAPAFYGKNSESPTQFLIRVQEYAESVHAWDRATLLNGISQFLRESALEWYCQLRISHRRPQTWVEFTDLFLAQFNSPVRKARQEQEWHQCKQKENETINEFLVRLRALWREQKPKETESDLVKHLFCRMRNDLLNMIGISRNASLDEVITEVQQIEEILYRRSKGDRLTKQIKEIETLPKKLHNENNTRQTSSRWNNETRNYQVNEVAPSPYTSYQNQTTVAPNWRQSANPSACYYCGGYRHSSNYCPTQNGNFRQQRNTPRSKNDRGALDERTRTAPL